MQSQDGEHLMEYGGDGEENASSGTASDAPAAASQAANTLSSE
jgi:hypothetical protein